MKTVRITKLTDNNVKDVLALIEEYPDVFSTLEFDIYRGVVLKHLLEMDGFEHDVHHILVATMYNKEVVGCVIFEKMTQSRGYYLIDYLIVKKEYQHMGIGKMLMMQAFMAIKGLGGKQAMLETEDEKHNERVKKFYTKLGFKEAGELPDFFAPSKKEHKHNQDCIIYYKKL